MTDINNYVEYFRTLAREHKEINDFYMMDINEPLDALRSNIKYPALILTILSEIFTHGGREADASPFVNAD